MNKFFSQQKTLSNFAKRKFLKRNYTQQNQAFTLLELAVVLMLIGIIVGGIMQGANLVTSSRLASARSLTSKSPIGNISGLIGWYESSSKNSVLVTQAIDSTNISEWSDISPSSIINKKNKLTKTSNSNITFSIASINKIPAINFKNNEKISLNNFYQGSLNRATICVVFRPNFTPSSNPAVLVDSYFNQSSFSLAIKNNAVNLNAGIDVNTSTASNSANFINGRDYILCSVFNGSQSGVYVNDAINLTGGSLINAGSNFMNGLTIGSDRNGSNAFSGLIAEVIIFNRPLKIQERRDVMLYLAKKYRVNIVS
jgi:prepilin-type N-terminal cleavage/methylation domain-containing protein